MQEQMGAIARKELNMAFRKFDSDGSGHLQKNQFYALIRRLTAAFGVQDPSNDELDDIWNQIDVNGDKRLSRVEFEYLIEDIVKILSEESHMGKKLSSGDMNLTS